MPQERKTVVSALNVRIVDKKCRDYPALFQQILRLRRAIRVRGTDHLILTSFGPSVDGSRVPFSGSIGKYTDIPEGSEWLDTVSLLPAEDDRLEQISIPSDLKPNYQAFFCCLFPDKHIFAFETYSDSESISPRSVEKWFRAVVQSRPIVTRFGDIEVDLIPDYGTLNRILDSEKIRTLHIVIKRTNPDDYDAKAFEAAESRLQRLNAAEEDTTYKAPNREYLDLDEETKALARVGAENGSVSARIMESGSIVPVSTAERPLEVQGRYSPDDIEGQTFFRSLALKLLGMVRVNRNGGQQPDA